MRALVTGADGQLGRELRRTAPAGTLLSALGRSSLDVRSRSAVERVLAELRPGVVINAAAYTAVDGAEGEREEAFAVNCEGAGNVARAARQVGARLVHLSTDFVFDGARGRPYRPDDRPRPLGVYGASKLAGEERVVAETGGQGLIVRTSWLYSRFGRNFVTAVLDRLHGEEELRVVSDQIGSPTWAKDLARALWRLVGRPATGGILHFANAGVASRYDLAMAIRDEARALGQLARDVAIRPITSDALLDRKAPRPPFSVLEVEPTWRALGWEAVHWRGALHSMLSEGTEESDG